MKEQKRYKYTETGLTPVIARGKYPKLPLYYVNIGSGKKQQ